MNFYIESQYEEEKKRWRIKVSGEVDIFNSSEFKHDLIGLFEERNEDMYIDCSELDYIDSTALGSLVSVLKKIKDSGREIYLSDLKPSLEKIFKITNLDKVFIILGGDKND